MKQEMITISSSSSEDSTTPYAAGHHHQPSLTTTSAAVTSPSPPQDLDRASTAAANRRWVLGFAGRLLQSGPLPRRPFMGASGSRTPPGSLWVPRSELRHEEAPLLDDIVKNKGDVRGDPEKVSGEEPVVIDVSESEDSEEATKVDPATFR